MSQGNLNIQRARSFKRIAILVSLCLIALMLTGCFGQRFEPTAGWAGVIAQDDTVWAGTQEGRIVALESRNGSELWRFPHVQEEPLTGIYSTPALHGDLLYLGDYTGHIYALKSSNGQKVWQQRTNGPIIGGITVTEDLVLVGSSDGYLYAFDTLEGNLRWKFASENQIWSTPKVQDETIYFGSMDHHVYAVDLKGNQLWRFRTAGAVAANPWITNGKVFIGSFDRNLYALDAASGKLLWKFAGNNWFWSSAIGDDKQIYVGNLDGNLYALDYRGRKKWEVPTGGPIVSSPVLSKGLVAVASDGKRFYVVSPTTGTIQWDRDIRAMVRAPLTAHGQIVYLTALDRSIRAMDLGKSRQIWRFPIKE